MGGKVTVTTTVTTTITVARHRPRRLAAAAIPAVAKGLGYGPECRLVPRSVIPGAAFRIPGLGRSKAVEDVLAARSLVAFSADVAADHGHSRITLGTNHPASHEPPGKMRQGHIAPT